MNKKFKKADVCVLCFSSDNKNYGANLICYAMSAVIKKLGYSVNILNFYKKSDRLDSKKYNPMSEFREKYIELTPYIRYFFQFYLLNFLYKVFITGSDQVFNVLNTKPYEKRYFLDFVKNNRGKIAFSASFGMEQFAGGQKLIQQAGRLLSRFDFISVREKAGIKILKDTFGSDFNAIQTIDPTLMLEEDDYKSIMSDSDFKVSGKYIAYYMLSPEYGFKKQETQEGLELLKNTYKIPLINILYDENNSCYKAGSWLNYIKNAEFIVTDSFHGVCFSIIFKKKFAFISRIGAGRIENLLCLLGLNDRIFKTFDAIYINDINYEKVYEKLQFLKDESYNFLGNAIKQTINSKHSREGSGKKCPDFESDTNFKKAITKMFQPALNLTRKQVVKPDYEINKQMYSYRDN